MATERIDIVVTERGTRTVKRNLDSLATAAEQADSNFNALKNAISKITPTAQLSKLMEQINDVKNSLSGSRSIKNWMKISIEDANAAIVDLSGNLRNVKAAMAGSTNWTAIAEFRKAEEELNDIIAKLQRVRAMQNLHVNTSAQLKTTGGVAPSIPQVVTLPETRQFAKDADLAAHRADRLRNGLSQIGVAAKGAHVPFSLLNRYVGAFGSIVIGQQLMQLADSATVVSNRITIVSGSVDEATEATKELFAVARRTRTPIEEMAQLYQKVMMASTELGISQRDAFSFVEAVGMGLAVQGASANTARGALIQLSQAIGTDIVRAEEFNSILEGAYPIALAAARGIDEAGGSVAKLRRLVIEGKISSKEFFDAILSQYPEIADMFGKTASTISQAFTVLRNKTTEYIANSKEAKAISKLVADSIILIADNLKPIADVLFSLGIAWGVAFTGTKIAAVARMATSTGALATSMTLLRGALGFLGGPIVGGLSLLAGASFWVYQNMDSAATQIERLSRVMDEGVTALQNYNQWVKVASEEQAGLGGAVNLTTEAMLRQTRADLQASLRALQAEKQVIEDNLGGNSWNPLDVDNIQGALSELRGSGGNEPGFGNVDLENLYYMLEAFKNGTGDAKGFIDEIQRLRGIGPEVDSVIENLGLALDAFDSNDGTEQAVRQRHVWLTQAVEDLKGVAQGVGGFEDYLAALENFSPTNFGQVQDAIDLAEKLQNSRDASEFLGQSSWLNETADLLKALTDAKAQEDLMLKALGANVTQLQQITTEAEKFRKPMEDSAGAASDTDASLRGISFIPLQDGAKGFADELARAAEQAGIIRGYSNSTQLPKNNDGSPTEVAYKPQDTMAFLSTSGRSGGLNGGAYDTVLSELARQGVQSIRSVLSTSGTEVANSNTRPGLNAGTNLVDVVGRTGQSKEYLEVLTSINDELDTQYKSLVLSGDALDQETAAQDLLQQAVSKGIVLSQQDIKLINERVAALSALEEKVKLINDVNDAVFDGMETALNNFVQTGTFNFSEFARSIITDLAQIAIQMMVIAPLKNLFGGVIGNLIGGLPGHNEGADFMVQGTGGVDKNVVAFRASRGERVQVTPAGKSSDSAAPVVNFYINTPDVAGFRRSEAQIAARAQQMLSRGQRNT